MFDSREAGNSGSKIRDFSEKQYGNHMFPRHSTVPRVAVLSITVLSVLVLGAALFVRSPWFFIGEVRIEGLEYVNEEGIRGVIEESLSRHRYGIIPERHRAFFRPEEVQAKLMGQFALDDATVTRTETILSVRVKEKPTGVLVSDGKHAVFADLAGFVTRDATLEEIELAKSEIVSPPFLTLTTEGEIPTAPGSQIFTSAFLANLISLKLHFEVETGLPVSAYLLPRAQASWMKVRLEDGRDIYVDLERDIEPQIQKLLTLLKEKGSEVAKVSYIDLRFLDRIYYK